LQAAGTFFNVTVHYSFSIPIKKKFVNNEIFIAVRNFFGGILGVHV